MKNKYNCMLDRVGNTPLVRLEKIERIIGTDNMLFAKLEGVNPSGSVKDRTAIAMIRNAEKTGLINSNTVIVEPTSGNTGISLAMVGAYLGYRTIIVLPRSASIERVNRIRLYGAEPVLVDGGMSEAIAEARRIKKNIANSYMPDQFTNSVNRDIHYLTTGPEIYNDTSRRIDSLVCGIGSAGTIMGTAEYLKGVRPNVMIIGVEPSESRLLSGGKASSHGIEGIGADFVPPLFKEELCDRIINVSTEEAEMGVAMLYRQEGISSGISGGAALFAARKLIEKENLSLKCTVIILPDGGDREKPKLLDI